MSKLILLLFSFLLLSSCSTSNSKPYFKQIRSDYLNKKFTFSKDKDFIDTLIKTKNYEFYWVPEAGDVQYFLKRENKLFDLEPTSKMEDGFENVQVINDSTLIFYTQFYNRIFGDSWVIKNGSNIDVKLDPGRISNTTADDLFYKNGKLMQIGRLNVNLDSLQIKKLRNKLYELKNDSLVEVNDYSNIKKDIAGFKDGVYYFSYPGRHILDTLYLNK